MHKDKFITFTELIDVLRNDFTNNTYKSAADNLLEAFTDWPTQDIGLSELISELKEEISGKLTFDNLNKYLKTLKPNTDSWKMESLTSLLKLFDFEQNKIVNKEIELETIIEKITEYYRK